jgi:uncharacterized protein (DUF305 family)
MMRGQGPGVGATVDAARWFIEEMIPHHEDAVAMADLALTRAEHQEIKDLAAAIKTSQTREIAQMRAWYQQWYGTLPQGSRMPHRWDTRTLTGAQPFDRAFIEQMVPHHQMAVMMATMALPRVEQPELRQLLLSIIGDQSSEISSMGQWYRAWYGGPVPGMGPGMMGGGMMGGGMMPPNGPPAGRPGR